MTFRVNIKELLNVVAEDASGEGPVVSTGSKGPDKTRSVDTYVGTTSCRFILNCTAHTGTDMLVQIMAEVNGVDVLIASFTSVTAIVQESIVVELCPVNVKVVYTENAMTDFDCTVHSVRF
jgi:hypothetical protein